MKENKIIFSDLKTLGFKATAETMEIIENFQFFLEDYKTRVEATEKNLMEYNKEISLLYLERGRKFFQLREELDEKIKVLKFQNGKPVMKEGKQVQTDLSLYQHFLNKKGLTKSTEQWYIKLYLSYMGTAPADALILEKLKGKEKTQYLQELEERRMSIFSTFVEQDMYEKGELMRFTQKNGIGKFCEKYSTKKQTTTKAKTAPLSAIKEVEKTFNLEPKTFKELKEEVKEMAENGFSETEIMKEITPTLEKKKEDLIFDAATEEEKQEVYKNIFAEGDPEKVNNLIKEAKKIIVENYNKLTTDTEDTEDTKKEEDYTKMELKERFLTVHKICDTLELELLTEIITELQEMKVKKEFEQATTAKKTTAKKTTKKAN